MRSFFHGAADLLDTPEGIVPVRFTKAQMAFFDPLIYRFRSYNAAGIRLEFRTDSPFFRMAYAAELKPDTTEKLSFDIYVDDVLVASPADFIADRGSGEWTVPLPIGPGRPRRVVVYLPYLAKIAIRDMQVAPGALWEPVHAKPRMLLCLGDSITQGMNATRPSSTYAALLSRFLEMELLNQAVSGYVFDAGTIDAGLPRRPDLITVAYGTNDWVMRESHRQFESAAGAYLEKLTQSFPDVPILVLTPIYRMDIAEPQPAGTLDDIRRTLERLCSRHRTVRCVDGLSLVPHLPEFYADGLHPNDEGFLYMALNLAKRIADSR
jgi:lysophospholipase L1-like esterase